MKQIKKFLGVFLALAMVVGMVGMMPAVEAKATNVVTEITNLEYDYKTSNLVVKFNGTALAENTTETVYLYIGVPASKSGKLTLKAYEVIEVKAKGVEDVNTAYVDVSNLVGKKDVTFWVHLGDEGTKAAGADTGDKVKTIAIEKNDTKLKVAYVPNGVPEEGKSGEWFTFTDSKTKAAYTGAVEYRVGTNGKWESYTPTAVVSDLEQSAVYGNTFYFRTEGTATQPASKEAKVKIAAMAKAPNVTIDYLKLTVKFPKNAEVLHADADTTDTTVTAIDAWTILKTKENKGIADLAQVVDIEDDISFKVRVAATNRKPASKITAIDITAQGEGPATNPIIIDESGRKPVYKSIFEVEIQYTFTDPDGSTAPVWKSVKKDKTISPGTNTKIWVRYIGTKPKAATSSADPVIGVLTSKAVPYDLPTPSGSGGSGGSGTETPKSTACELISINGVAISAHDTQNSPGDGSGTGTSAYKITDTATGKTEETDSLSVDEIKDMITVSSKAIFIIYTDNTFSNELDAAIGASKTLYIKVIAEDGTTVRYYQARLTFAAP